VIPSPDRYVSMWHTGQTTRPDSSTHSRQEWQKEWKQTNTLGLTSAPEQVLHRFTDSHDVVSESDEFDAKLLVGVPDDNVGELIAENCTTKANSCYHSTCAIIKQLRIKNRSRHISKLLITNENSTTHSIEQIANTQAFYHITKHS